MVKAVWEEPKFQLSFAIPKNVFQPLGSQCQLGTVPIGSGSFGSIARGRLTEKLNVSSYREESEGSIESIWNNWYTLRVPSAV